MNIYSAAELTSIYLTSVSLFLIIALLVVFFPGMREALGVSRKVWRASQWLVVGVWLSHFGSFFDNSYWNIAWVSSFKALAAKTWLFKHGVFANIPFRNITGIVSTFCHLKGAFLMLSSKEDAEKNNTAEKLLLASFVFSFFVTSAVWVFL